MCFSRLVIPTSDNLDDGNDMDFAASDDDAAIDIKDNDGRSDGFAPADVPPDIS
jgi:hypothetical protein